MPILYQYKASGNVPSLDFDCLLVQTFFKFSKFQYEVRDCNTPTMSPNESLPFLRLEDDSMLVQEDLFAHVRKLHGSRDSSLSAQQQADSLAFKQLILSKLKTALLFDLWLDPDNFEYCERKYIGNDYDFLLNYLIPWRERSKITSSILLRMPTIDKLQVLEEAEAAIKALSEKLGNQAFLFGDEPTEVDAYLYAYLQIALNTFLPNSENRYLINNYPNLVKYASRISSEYFKVEESPKKNKEKENEKEKEIEIKENDNSDESKIPQESTSGN